MNDLIEQIYQSGYVQDVNGNKYKHTVASIQYDTGALLYDFIRTFQPENTIEIGLAYGLSALFICQAHQDNGSGNHTAIDPIQEEHYKSIGLLNIERANLRHLFRFHEAHSDKVLSMLCSQKKKFDFAFIDGSHLFDYALVDFFYIDKLLSVGGHVAFDDLWMAGVRRVISFVLKNRPYKVVRIPSRHTLPISRQVMMVGRRIVQNPFERDWALKLIPHNIVLLKKTGIDSRDWNHYSAF